MKIVLLKDTMQGKKGATVKVAPSLAKYHISCNNAIEFIAPIKKEKNDNKPTTTRKSKAKS